MNSSYKDPGVVYKVERCPNKNYSDRSNILPNSIGYYETSTMSTYTKDHSTNSKEYKKTEPAYNRLNANISHFVLGQQPMKYESMTMYETQNPKNRTIPKQPELKPRQDLEGDINIVNSLPRIPQRQPGIKTSSDHAFPRSQNGYKYNIINGQIDKIQRAPPLQIIPPKDPPLHTLYTVRPPTSEALI